MLPFLFTHNHVLKIIHITIRLSIAYSIESRVKHMNKIIGVIFISGEFFSAGWDEGEEFLFLFSFALFFSLPLLEEQN